MKDSTVGGPAAGCVVGPRVRRPRGRLLMLGGALAMVAAGLLPAFGDGVLAQQEESCDCAFPRLLTGGNAFSFFRSGAMLGVSLDMDVDRELEDTGVRVVDVVEEGPADEAGIRAGDVIASLDGHDLTEPLEDRVERRFDDDRSFPGQRLVALARELEEGEPVEVTVVREGERRSFTVTPEELDRWQLGNGMSIPDVTRRLSDFRGQLQDLSFDVDGGNGSWVAPRVQVWNGPDRLISLYGAVQGLELVALNPGLGAYFGTEIGVLVADVEDESTLGLEAGDVLLEIDGRRIDDPDHARRVLSSYREGEVVEFHIMRDGSELRVSGEMK